MLIKRLTVRGLIITDHSERLDDFLRDVSAWLREGRVKCREERYCRWGWSRARSVDRLLQGRNFGKLIVRVVKKKWRSE